MKLWTERIILTHQLAGVRSEPELLRLVGDHLNVMAETCGYNIVPGQIVKVDTDPFSSQTFVDVQVYREKPEKKHEHRRWQSCGRPANVPTMRT